MNAPVLLIIAGPNGAGKTTTAMHLLPNVLNIRHFVNADMIAGGLSPFDPLQVNWEAAKIMVMRMEQLIEQQETFAVETTLASRSFVSVIKKCKNAGYYNAELLFTALPTPELAKERVALRVSRGGHNVPEKIIERRFYAGLKNFFYLYSQLVDQWIFAENVNTSLRIIAERKFKNNEVNINDLKNFIYYQNLAET
ncbi:MAG: zeta toxin family protein [Planctomycetaceae bacterium]|jgi:predicted ABC-type ATPase|nr:zeta toxin family protein [Planctomycetaceae bacterium]